ncbi:hypothetical protein XELAEV_18016385mg [Xenopus laevis]|uniref:Uncharacterized protein n=1 Tax=Xenopus laevis TaxID=8355 RepID=A0A974HX01_XENLA|nr:hypothetical protein XELAEV_18016385mg [Xenopus laevis]
MRPRVWRSTNEVAPVSERRWGGEMFCEGGGHKTSSIKISHRHYFNSRTLTRLCTGKVDIPCRYLQSPAGLSSPHNTIKTNK